MKQQSKLTSQQQQEQQQRAAEQQTHQQSPLEFASAEQMLRHDALHTPVPPAIAHRLQKSLDQMTLPPRAWWRRWFEK